MTYKEELKMDIKTWIEDNKDYIFDIEDYANDTDSFVEFLNETLWICDEVTGNASGSYTFNRNEAKEKVIENMEEVHEALTEFCYESDEIGKMFINEEWEKIDVITRCYFLNSAIWEVIEEENIDEYLETLEV